MIKEEKEKMGLLKETRTKEIIKEVIQSIPSMAITLFYSAS